MPRKKKNQRMRFLRPKGCISPNEAGKMLGITGEAVKQWIYRGKLKAAKAPNGYWWVREKDVKDFVSLAQSGKDLEFKLHDVKA